MSRPSSASFVRRVLPAALLAAGAGGLLGRIQPMSSTAASAPEPAPAPVPTVAPSAAPTVLTVPAPGPQGGTAATEPPPEAPTTTAAPVVAPGTCGAPEPGPVDATRWGPVQVAAAFTPEGTLCDVVVLQYPSDHRKSQRINERALPILHDLAIEAQGTDFQTVSGATVTTRGYKASLQAILDNR